MILAFGAIQSYADQINLVQTLEIQLVGMEQGTPVTVGNITMDVPVMQPIGTARVIAALGTALDQKFSKAATITVTTPMPEGALTFTVIDGSTSMDVTGFFKYQQFGDSIESWLTNNKTGKTFTTTYSVCEFALQDCPGYPTLTLHFDVTALATESLLGADALLPGNGLSAMATGTGDVGGTPAIIQGAFAFRGDTLVDVPGGGGAND
jgi:hypothetical protein